MSKTIELEYKGKAYTLEFDRKQVERMERRGFSPEELTTKPMSSLPLLFAGAFQKHHRNLNPDIIEEILGKVKDREKLFAKLVEMYNEPILTLFDEPDEDEANIDWDTNW